MAFRDQKKYLEYLRKFEKKFNNVESEEYKMFIKRDKDEEEFDTVSMDRLRQMYNKYYVPVDKSKYDAFFKKKDDEKSE